MSDQLARPAFLSDAQPTAVIDDAAMTRAQDVLTESGVKIETGTLRQALNAAVTPELPKSHIPVSVGMAAAGREYWLAHPADSVHVLLPAMYRVMDQKRRDEGAATAEAALAAEAVSP